jgi:ribosomal protein S18 acetylase RimI-like enzyme
MNLKPTCRPYQTEEDFWKMREFLRMVFLLNNRIQIGWHVARLDYARWHVALNCAHVGLEEVVTLWEDAGQLVAILMPDGGPGEAHFLVHPRLSSPQLEEEMLRTAEEHLAAVEPDGSRQLTLWNPARNLARRELFQRCGYLKGNESEHQWQRDLDAPILEAPLAAGYTIRSLGDGLELLERCYASGLGFHQGDLGIAVENRTDPTWYRNIQTAALYRRDLDLVAVSPDGAIAAFCTIWFDDVTRSAYFEPVATVPEHQRRGLGKAVMTEGLRRLKRMGCTRAFVSGYSPAANALYQAVMGPVHELYEPWQKHWALSPRD